MVMGWTDGADTPAAIANCSMSFCGNMLGFLRICMAVLTPHRDAKLKWHIMATWPEILEQ